MIKTNICILETHYRSRPWYKAFSPKNIIAIATMPEEIDYMKDLGIKKERILDLNYKSLFINKFTNEKLLQFEKKYNFKYSDIAESDRRLSKLNFEQRLSYLFDASTKIEHFLLKFKPQVVFQELTWSHERLTFNISKKLNIQSLIPIQTKIVKNTFFFSLDKNRSLLLRNNNLSKKQKNEFRKKIIEKINNKKIKPDFFIEYSKKHKPTIKQFLNFIDDIRLQTFNLKNYYIQDHSWSILLKKLCYYIRSVYPQNYSNYKEYSNFKIILFCLHVQPEASIDVSCQDYSDQLNVIRIFAKNLPAGYILAIKEHPHAIGSRPINFYKEAKKFGSVIIIHPYQKIENFFNKNYCYAVGSISGFSPFEAALNNQRSFIFQRNAYSDFLTIPEFNPYKDNWSDFFVNLKKNKKINLNKCINELILYFYEGSTQPLNRDKSVIEKTNVDKIKIAFNDALKDIKNEKINSQ